MSDVRRDLGSESTDDGLLIHTTWHRDITESVSDDPSRTRARTRLSAAALRDLGRTPSLDDVIETRWHR